MWANNPKIFSIVNRIGEIIVVREKIIEGDFRGENEILNDEVNFLSVS